MALTKYQKFVKKHKHLKKPNGSLDLAKIGALWQEEKGGKSTPRRKSQTSTRGAITVTTRRTTKDTVKKRPKGKRERQVIKFKKEFDDIARSLRAPLSKTTFKVAANKWNLKIPGLGKTIKRKKLGDAMKIVRTRARKAL